MPRSPFWGSMATMEKVETVGMVCGITTSEQPKINRASSALDFMNTPLLVLVPYIFNASRRYTKDAMAAFSRMIRGVLPRIPFYIQDAPVFEHRFRSRSQYRGYRSQDYECRQQLCGRNLFMGEQCSFHESDHGNDQADAGELVRLHAFQEPIVDDEGCTGAKEHEERQIEDSRPGPDCMAPRFQRPCSPEKRDGAECQLQSGGDDGVNFMQAVLGVDDGPRTENHGGQMATPPSRARLPLPSPV